MKRIYIAEATWDAQMVRDLLVTRGIDAEIAPADVDALFPAGEGHSQSVWIVNDDDESQAMELVRGFRADVAAYPQDSGIVWKWRCAKCGEAVEPQFEVCWNCGTERPPR